MKQTAVEFLEQELNMVKSSSTKMYGQIIFLEKDVIQLLNQAKEMEKEQIIKARQDIFHTGNLSAEEYYNETYGSMITDIPITNKDKEELNEILNKVQRNLTFKSE
jgi:phospholipid N-methyltransferase